MQYEPIQAENFAVERDELKNQYGHLISNLIRDIIQEPFRNSVVMEEDYKGMRRRAKGRIRILYSVCGDCRENGHMEYIKEICRDYCESNSDITIVFFHVGLRGILY